MNDIHKEFYIKYLQPADKEDWLANIILLKVPPKVLVILKHHRLMLLQAPLSWRWKPFSERKNEQCRFYNSFIKLPQTKPKWNKRWKNRATSSESSLFKKQNKWQPSDQHWRSNWWRCILLLLVDLESFRWGKYLEHYSTLILKTF